MQVSVRMLTVWSTKLINTKKVEMFSETWFLHNFKKCIFREMKTDFKNRLKHQVEVNGHCNHLALKFSVCVKERQDRLPTMYWLPKLHQKKKKKYIKHDLLQTQVLVLQLNFLNY